MVPLPSNRNLLPQVKGLATAKQRQCEEYKATYAQQVQALNITWSQKI